jgi:hypothetical protein
MNPTSVLLLPFLPWAQRRLLFKFHVSRIKFHASLLRHPGFIAPS